METAKMAVIPIQLINANVGVLPDMMGLDAHLINVIDRI